MLYEVITDAAEEGQQIGALTGLELMRVFGAHHQHAGQTALAEIEPYAGLGADPETAFAIDVITSYSIHYTKLYEVGPHIGTVNVDRLFSKFFV